MADMTDFLKEMAEILEIDHNITAEYELGDEWDSLAIVSTIALVDETFGVFLKGDDLEKCTKIQSILDLVSLQSA